MSCYSSISARFATVEEAWEGGRKDGGLRDEDEIEDGSLRDCIRLTTLQSSALWVLERWNGQAKDESGAFESALFDDGAARFEDGRASVAAITWLGQVGFNLDFLFDIVILLRLSGRK